MMILAEMRPALLSNGLISESDYADCEDHINSEEYADIQYSTFLKMAQIAAIKRVRLPRPVNCRHILVAQSRPPENI